MSVHLEIKGLDKALRGLDEGTLNTMMRNAMQGATQELQADMMVYPPPPPNSTYRRTNTLKHGWATKVTGQAGSWLGVIGNRVKYAPFVQDEDRQADVHRGRWQTVQSVTKDKADWVVNFVSRAINAWIARM